MITVEHVDFISVPTQDVPRAKHFYGELLGLELEKDTPAGAEYRAGQVTLGIWAPESQGLPFQPNQSGFALRVSDVAQARKELEDAGVVFDMGAQPVRPSSWTTSATSSSVRSVPCPGRSRNRS